LREEKQCSNQTTPPHNIGGGTQSVYIGIKKDIPMLEPDKAKLTAWVNEKGFTVSRRKRILHAE